MYNYLQYVEYIASGIILIYGVFFAINRMSCCTNHDVRTAWVFLTVGAMSTFLWPCVSHPLLICGVALFVIADKRRCAECSTGDAKIEWL